VLEVDSEVDGVVGARVVAVLVSKSFLFVIDCRSNDLSPYLKNTKFRNQCDFFTKTLSL